MGLPYEAGETLELLDYRSHAGPPPSLPTTSQEGQHRGCGCTAVLPLSYVRQPATPQLSNSARG
jgi:hypothetical protein